MANRQAGFTLIEMMVVLAIGGILAALAIPNLSNLYESASLSAEARSLYAAFIQAQGLAASSSEEAWLVLDKAGNGWSIQADTNGDGTRETTERHTFRSDAVIYGPDDGVANAFGAPYQNVDHDSWCADAGTACSTTSGTIHFSPDGTVSNADSGAIFLQHPEDASECYALVFIGATGNVRILKVSP